MIIIYFVMMMFIIDVIDDGFFHPDVDAIFDCLMLLIFFDDIAEIVLYFFF